MNDCCYDLTDKYYEYEYIGEKVTCSKCGKKYEITYDEMWDGEEEWSMFGLEEI